MDDRTYSKLIATGPDPNLPLLPSQRPIVKRILLHIYEIARIEAVHEASATAETYAREQYENRPHQVFLIDGARGSGKTMSLLVIQQYLRQLGRPENWTGGSAMGHKARKDLAEFSEAIQKDPDAGDPFDFKTPHDCRGRARRTAFYLPVLFPSDLEMGQSIMEGLLALMIKSISEMASYKKKHDKGTDFDRWKRDSDALAKKAGDDVAAGWFLSRNAGTDAILRDSVDYKDYLRSRSNANVTSFDRVATWRAFVNEYLDFFNSELLVVFFDDTDLAPEVTRDILHTIRIFLDHPRIVTVIAGNLRAMRQAVLLEEMRNLRDPMAALPAGAEFMARNWRSFVRRQIEESLEKVLPRQFRHYIVTEENESFAGKVKPPKGIGDPTGAPSQPAEDAAVADRGGSDFDRVFGVSVDELAGKMLNRYRDDFLTVKHRAYFRWLEDRQEIADFAEYDTLENYTSWWVFRHWYADQLRPRTARHMQALRAFTPNFFPRTERKPASRVDRMRSEQKKRLTVILFESPENHVLIHRMADEDKKVLQWLRRQKVRSTWVDNRYIEINERRIDERSYTHDYICFRADVGIAMPVLENPDETLPAGLLPRPAGPNLNGRPPFFPRLKRHKLYGVASDLDHTLMPANCIFLSDLCAFSDVAWERPEQEGARDPWTERMIYDWPRYFFFDFDELQRSDKGGENASNSGHPDIQESWVKEYFVNVVLPFSSIEVGRFVPAPPELHAAGQWDLDKCAAHSLLKAELSSGNLFFKEEGTKIDGTRRQFDYLETVGAKLKVGNSVAPVAGTLLSDWRQQLLEELFPRELKKLNAKPNPLRDHLCNYEWLVNDVRRAWHAGRIFLNQTSSALKKHSAVAASGASSVVNTPEMTRRDRFAREDRYVLATRRALTRWLERSDTIRELYEAVDKLRFGELPQDTELLARADADIGIEKRPDGLHYILPGWLGDRVLDDVKDIIEYDGPAGAEASLNLAALSPGDLKRFLTTTEKIDSVRKWPLLLDPGLQGQSDQQGAGDAAEKSRMAARTARTHARLSRALLLYLCGISPTFPALIHIEIAAVLRNFCNVADPETHASGLRKSRAVLNHWRRQIRRHLDFVQSFRRVLEIAKLRLDVMMLCQECYGGSDDRDFKSLELEALTPSAFGVRMTLTPDISYGSLGIDGIRLFESHQFGLPEDLHRLRKCHELMKEKWQKTDKKAGRVRWRSIMDVVVENLVEALNFIEALDKVLVEKMSA